MPRQSTDPTQQLFTFAVERQLIREARKKALDDQISVAGFLRVCLRQYVAGSLPLLPPLPEEAQS